MQAAAGGQHSKPQRHVEAAKAACQLLEGAGGTKLAAGKGGWQEARLTVQRAQDAAAGNPKLAAALQRLEGLLAEQPSEEGKRGKKEGKPAGAAKKPKHA